MEIEQVYNGYAYGNIKPYFHSWREWRYPVRGYRHNRDPAIRRLLSPPARRG